MEGWPVCWGAWALAPTPDLLDLLTPTPPHQNIHVWLSPSCQHPVTCITCPGLPGEAQASQKQHPQADIEGGTSPAPAGDFPPSMSLFPCLHTFPGLNLMSAFLPSAFTFVGAVFTTNISVDQRCKGGRYPRHGHLHSVLSAGVAFQRRKRASIPSPVQ